MKPTDPVAAPLLPELLPCPFCGNKDLCMSIADPGAPYPGGYFEIWCEGEDCPTDEMKVSLKHYADTPEREAEGWRKAAAKWNTRTPLPPRADWALEAAREVGKLLKAEMGFNFAHLAEERLAAIITKHSLAAPDGEDTERLMEKCIEVMSAADDDIGQHISVARYNLTGMTQTGDQLPIPEPPLLIHSQGIRASEMVRTLLKEGICTLRAALDQARGQKE
jgi:hypothetical protein